MKAAQDVHRAVMVDVAERSFAQTWAETGCNKPLEQLPFLRLVAERTFLFRTSNNISFAVVQENGNRSICTDFDRDYTSWMRRLALSQCCTFNVKERTFTETLNIVKAFAQQDAYCERRELHRRCCRYGNTVYYDLGVNDEVVAISPNDVRIECNKQKHICFYPAFPQVYPSDSPSKESLVALLAKLFCFEDEGDLLLLAIYIVSCFLPDINHPILLLHGSPGSGKSTLMESVGRIIDPKPNHRNTMPSSTRDLVLALAMGYQICFDNLAYLTPEQCNILCSAVTGGTEVNRRLYTQNQLELTPIKACVGLNGVECATTASDLLDRCIVLRPAPITPHTRKTEASFWKHFDQLLPHILASIFDTVSAALPLFGKKISYQPPRMADFAKSAWCVATVWDEQDRFSDVYNKNIAFSQTQAKPPLVIACLLALLSAHPIWSGTPAQLYEELVGISRSKKGYATQLPSNAAALSRWLEKSVKELDFFNISYDRRRSTKRMILLRVSEGKDP